MKSENKALLLVLQRSLLYLRHLGSEGQKSHGLSKDEAFIIRDLAEALHNIPKIILSDTESVENNSLERVFKDFDEAYPSLDLVKLLDTYKENLS